jgi:hypothetical protein
VPLGKHSCFPKGFARVFVRLCFNTEKNTLMVIKGQCPLEGEGIEVGTSKYFPVTYLNL